MYHAFLSKRLQRYVLFLNSEIFNGKKLSAYRFLPVFSLI